MCSTKVVRKAALLVASAAELLLTTSTVPWKEDMTPPVVEPGDGWTQLWEPRQCTACGTEGPFWAIYEPEGEETHAYMTMCMTCGAINGDLPEDNPAHWLNVFRSEPHDNIVYETEPDCTVIGTRETVCFRCGWSTVKTLPALGHQYGPWTVETAPGPGTEGTEVRICSRCGSTERRTVPALPEASPEPTDTPPATAVPTETPYETMPGETAVPSEVPSTSPELRTSVRPEPAETQHILPSEFPLQSESPETMTPKPMESSPVPVVRPSRHPTAPQPTREIPGGSTEQPEQTIVPAPSDPPEETSPAVPSIRTYGPYVSGTTEGLFLPEKPVTRAEVWMMLARILADQNGDALPEGDRIYGDVPSDRWYSPGVAYLSALSILPKGGEDVFLKPDQLLSEAELADLLGIVFQDNWSGHGANTITRAGCVVQINRAAGRVADPVWLREHLEELKTFPDLPEEDGAWSDVLDAANGNRGNRERVN